MNMISERPSSDGQQERNAEAFAGKDGRGATQQADWHRREGNWIQ